MDEWAEVHGLDPPDIPFGNVPMEWFGSLSVTVVEGTRWFVEKGHMHSFRHWFDELQRANPGNLIPMQWAPQYIGVSRPAIRKRAMAGKLTVFSYSLKEQTKTLLGKVEYRESRTSFDYLVIEECVAWRSQLFEHREEELNAYEAEFDARAKGSLPAAHKKSRRKKKR